MKKGKTNIHRTKIMDHILKNRSTHLRSIFLASKENVIFVDFCNTYGFFK